MSKYTFYIDREYTQWDRWTYEIEADSEEEAIDYMKEEFEDPTFEDSNGAVFSLPLEDTCFPTDKEELIYVRLDDDNLGTETIIDSKS